ncbi:hypothetical protein ACJX0J_011816 [Zea mays]
MCAYTCDLFTTRKLDQITCSGMPNWKKKCALQEYEEDTNEFAVTQIYHKHVRIVNEITTLQAYQNIVFFQRGSTSSRSWLILAICSTKTLTKHSQVPKMLLYFEVHGVELVFMKSIVQRIED